MAGTTESVSKSVRIAYVRLSQGVDRLQPCMHRKSNGTRRLEQRKVIVSSSTSSLPAPSGSKIWFDAGEASRFLQLLDPRALVFNFSWYSEKGTRTQLPEILAPLDATYRNAPYDKEFAYILALLNGHQRAIYVCMNVLGAKNGSEARTDENVARVRA